MVSPSMAQDIETGKHRGFTLLELMIVMIIMTILIGIAIPVFKGIYLRSRETTLKVNLHTLREVIDQYTADKKKAPQTLQDLIDAGYLRELPWDPITNQRDTWVPDFSTTVAAADQTDSGINDVHSGSNAVSSEGTLYNTW
jgi:general secretion pathway protein G